MVRPYHELRSDEKWGKKIFDTLREEDHACIVTGRPSFENRLEASDHNGGVLFIGSDVVIA